MMTRWQIVGAVLGFATLLTPQQALATRSIAACDPNTGECGVATISGGFGAGEDVPYGDVGFAVANQSAGNHYGALALLSALASGSNAQSALDEVLPNAFDPGWWQVGIAALDPSAASGVSVAAYTGSTVSDQAPNVCSVLGATYVVVANRQSTAAICAAMAKGFDAAAGQQLARRMVAALVAGTAVGGDTAGEYSPGIKVWANNWNYPYTTLTVFVNVTFARHWMHTFQYQLEAWLAYWQLPGDPRELRVLTKDATQDILRTLHELGYYNGRMDRWSDEAEQALLNWEWPQFYWYIPTVLDGHTRMIEQTVLYLLTHGEGQDFLLPAP